VKVNHIEQDPSVKAANLHRYFSSRGPWHRTAMASLNERTRMWPVRWLKWWTQGMKVYDWILPASWQIYC